MFKTSSKTVVSLRRNDDGFFFSHNGVTLVPRAGIEISELCPENLRLAIGRAIGEGYLIPVAYMRDDEYTWERLQK